MIVCPVCEHQQEAGSECDQCGRRLEEGRGTDAPVAPIEGLEFTALDGAGAAAGAPAGEAMADLEVTRFEPAEEPLLAEIVEDLEQTRTEPVEVVDDPTPDVERVLAGLPDDGPSLLPLVHNCRYCRTEAGPGERICGRCGMKLELPSAAPVVAAGGPRLCSCGAPVTRSRCPACGARNATP
jgi:hypothetical protein